MTPVYEVKTKHTKKVLEDFIKFTYKIKYPRVTMNLLVLATCLAIFAFLMRGGIAMYIFGLLAVLLTIFALFRQRIGVNKLVKTDPNYQNQSEIDLLFGESEFHIKNPDLGQDSRVKYGEISYMYADDNYYYISINNEELQLIPKGDFILGDSTAFYDFISQKTGKPISPIHIPWKVRLRLMMEYRDAKAEELKRKQDEKKK